VLGLALAFVLIGAESKAAERDQAERWKPSIALQVQMQILDVESDAESSLIMGPPLPDSPVEFEDPCGGFRHGPETVWCPTAGSETIVSPVVSGVFELMTPRLWPGVGQGRLFASIAVGANRASSRDLAKDGVPGTLRRDPDDDPPTATFLERSVLGQGVRQTAELKPFTWTAALGLALAFDVGERQIRIKPSVEYTYFSIRYKNTTTRAVDLVPDGDPQDFDTDIRQINLADGLSEVYHAIGPALEVELDTYRKGPILMSLYLRGSMAAALGSMKVSSTVTNEFGESADYNYRLDRLSYRVGTGVRFSWLPE